MKASMRQEELLAYMDSQEDSVCVPKILGPSKS